MDRILQRAWDLSGVASLKLLCVDAATNQTFNGRAGLTGVNPSFIYYPNWASGKQDAFSGLTHTLLGECRGGR